MATKKRTTLPAVPDEEEPFHERATSDWFENHTHTAAQIVLQLIRERLAHVDGLEVLVSKHGLEMMGGSTDDVELEGAVVLQVSAHVSHDDRGTWRIDKHPD